MLLDRKHRSWGIATAVALAAASVAYAAYPRLSTRPYSGGSWVGLLLGVCAAAAMAFAGLLAVRKALPLLPVGSAQFWLRGHIWIGLLSAPLALYHASFRLGGPLEMLLMICLAVVLASGVFGLAMQQILPRLLKVRVPLETFAEQIPYLCRRFRAEGDALVAEHCGRLDVDFEPLRNEAFQFALAEGRLRNGREEEDFAKFLAMVYARSPQNGAADRRSENVKSVAPAAATPAHTAANGEPAEATSEIVTLPRVAGNAPSTNSPIAAKGKTVQDKLAMAKAAGAAKKAADAKNAADPMKAAASSLAADASSLEPPGTGQRKLSIQEKLAQAKSAGAAKKTEATTESQVDVASGISPAAEKRLSIEDKLAQAKAAGAAKKAEAATAAPAAQASDAAAVAEKKLSIQEKLAQAKAAGAAKARAAADPTKKSIPAKVSPKSESGPASKPETPARSGAQALLDKLAKKGKSEEPIAPHQTQPTSIEPMPRAVELLAFYLDEVRPFLEEDFRMVRQHPFTDETAARMRFANQGRELPDKLLAVQRRLEVLCDSRRQYLEQGRIRAWLHYWLLVHAPLSAVLFVLLAAHIVMALRVVPWEL